MRLDPREDPLVVAALARAADDVQVDVRMHRADGGDDVDDRVVVLLGCNASETDERVGPIRPRHIREGTGDRGVECLRRPAMPGAVLLTGPVRVDQRDVAVDGLAAHIEQARTDTVVEPQGERQRVVPPQVDMGSRTSKGRVVDVLETRPAEVGLVVGRHDEVVLVHEAAGRRHQQGGPQQGQWQGDRVDDTADPSRDLAALDAGAGQRCPPEAIDASGVERLPGEDGDAVVACQGLDHPGGQAIAAARRLERRLDEQDGLHAARRGQ